MSTMAAQQDYYEDDAPPRAETPASRLRAAAEKLLLAKEAAIVPADSIAGRALMAVIAIMTFLAALTLGATVLVRSAAGEWQSAVAREVTIQVRPAEQRDVEADVRDAVALAAGTAGIASARAYSKEESASLLEPWIGNGLVLNDLPIPRMIVVRVAPGETPDLAALRQQLTAQIPGATLDDHRGWIDRMRAMARNAALAGLAVLGLVFAATMLSVMFATRGAMSTNRQIIEVLHVIGARRDFIAGEFQRHFLLLGLKGGAIGGGVAILLFALIGLMSDWLKGGAEDNLFGNLSLGAAGYGAIIGLVLLVAGVTAGTSRLTVHRTLRAME
jgi:cell division transport system permease protein